MAGESVSVRSAEAIDGLRIELKVAMDRIPEALRGLQIRAAKTGEELMERRRGWQRSAEELVARIRAAGRADPPARDFAAERALQHVEEQIATIDNLLGRLSAATGTFSSAKARAEGILTNEGPKASEMLGHLTADVFGYNSVSLALSTSAQSPVQFPGTSAESRRGVTSAEIVALLASAAALGVVGSSRAMDPSLPRTVWGEVEPLDPTVVSAAGATSGWRSGSDTVLLLESATASEAARRAAVAMREPVTIVIIGSAGTVTALRSDGDDGSLVEVVPAFALLSDTSTSESYSQGAEADLLFVAVNLIDLDWSERVDAELVAAARRVPEIREIIERGGTRQILELIDRLEGQSAIGPGRWVRAYDVFFGADHIVLEARGGRYGVTGGHASEDLMTAARTAGLTHVPAEVHR